MAVPSLGPYSETLWTEEEKIHAAIPPLALPPTKNGFYTA
jgi:hypothetical protein